MKPGKHPELRVGRKYGSRRLYSPCGLRVRSYGDPFMVWSRTKWVALRNVRFEDDTGEVYEATELVEEVNPNEDI